MSAVIDLLGREHQEVLARIEQDEDRFFDSEVACAFLTFLEHHVVPHFRLEEEALFPRLEGIPHIAQGPLHVMEAEHCAFRELLDAGAEARRLGERRELQQAAVDLAALLQAHIAKEDRVLFPMALEALSEEQLREVDAAGMKL